jgi:hypothetical protein
MIFGIGKVSTAGERAAEHGIEEQDLDAVPRDVVKVPFGADGNPACSPVMSRADVMNVIKTDL